MAEEGRSPYEQAGLLAAIAPHLPGKTRTTALENAIGVARQIDDHLDRVRVLADLALHVKGSRLAEVWTEILSATRAAHPSGFINFVWRLEDIFPRLPRRLQAQALDLARDQRDPGYGDTNRGHLLCALAPHLSSELLTEALRLAREIDDSGWHVSSLIGLIPYLSPVQKATVLDEVLPMAYASDWLPSRRSFLIHLVPHVSPEQRPRVLADALALVGEPDPLSGEADRADDLAELAPYLPKDRLTEALVLARGGDDVEDRVRGLAAIAPYLPIDEQSSVIREALVAAMSVDDRSERVECLKAVVPAWRRLDDDEMYRLWIAAVRASARRSRTDLLVDLVILAPITMHLGSTDVVMHTFDAVQAVGVRWP